MKKYTPFVLCTLLVSLFSQAEPISTLSAGAVGVVTSSGAAAGAAGAAAAAGATAAATHSIASPKTPSAAASAAAPGQKKTPTSLKEKQLHLLETRQAQFRQAALEAKKSGQTEQAREYLRQYKGFDKLIEATKCGLPIDLHLSLIHI